MQCWEFRFNFLIGYMIIRGSSCRYSVDMICTMEEKHHGVNIDSSIS